MGRAWKAVLPALVSLLLVLACWLGVGIAPALAYDNPDLLPDHPTPVIDLAKALTDGQRTSLEENLTRFEADTGWKLRVLTQYDRTPGQAVKDFWNLDERSLLLVADERGGNLLNFNVGDALFALMPRTYWVELQTRFGNQYYVRDNGQDAAIVDALAAVGNLFGAGWLPGGAGPAARAVAAYPLHLRARWFGGGLRLLSAQRGTSGGVGLGAVALTPVADLVWCSRPGANPDPHQRPAAGCPQHACLPGSSSRGLLDCRSHRG